MTDPRLRQRLTKTSRKSLSGIFPKSDQKTTTDLWRNGLCDIFIKSQIANFQKKVMGESISFKSVKVSQLKHCSEDMAV